MRMRLVERAKEGDDVAFSELVDLDGDRCYAIAYRILRDAERAQDAVQQAFLLAWRELPRLRDPERFGPWLHRLLVSPVRGAGHDRGRARCMFIRRSSRLARVHGSLRTRTFGLYPHMGRATSP